MPPLKRQKAPAAAPAAAKDSANGAAVPAARDSERASSTGGATGSGEDLLAIAAACLGLAKRLDGRSSGDASASDGGAAVPNLCRSNTVNSISGCASRSNATSGAAAARDNSGANLLGDVLRQLETVAAPRTASAPSPRQQRPAVSPRALLPPVAPIAPFKGGVDAESRLRFLHAVGVVSAKDVAAASVSVSFGGASGGKCGSEDGERCEGTVTASKLLDALAEKAAAASQSEAGGPCAISGGDSAEDLDMSSRDARLKLYLQLTSDSCASGLLGGSGKRQHAASSEEVSAESRPRNSAKMGCAVSPSAGPRRSSSSSSSDEAEAGGSSPQGVSRTPSVARLDIGELVTQAVASLFPESPAGEGVKPPQKRAKLQEFKHQIPKDGYTWLKYGEKSLSKGSYSRHYFRCGGHAEKTAEDGAEAEPKRCPARRIVDVQKDPSEGELKITYVGEHNHAKAAEGATHGGAIVIEDGDDVQGEDGIAQSPSSVAPPSCEDFLSNGLVAAGEITPCSRSRKSGFSLAFEGIEEDEEGDEGESDDESEDGEAQDLLGEKQKVGDDWMSDLLEMTNGVGGAAANNWW
eukprot:TRINITY_DN5079_c0_g1_i1.p1 TRINITY_DN5079_c0_g1~~TRINITY_DN5079_c0_g1_i1.p1  ORF type:complete len:579 (+),score=9.40 TRINITY_DN5079_c0_g1_i1:841-2577(+)